MKVLLVVCNINLASHRPGRSRLMWESTHREGLASIAAVLEQDGVQVSLLKVEAGLPDADFSALFRRHFHDHDVADFTASTIDLPEVGRLARLIKQEHPRIVTIAGGVHPTLSPEETLAQPGLDMVCRGEGEYALRELCGQLRAGRTPAGIEGLWIKRDGAVERNPVRPLIADLGALPPPLHDIPTVCSYDARTVSDQAFFMGSRGCPYTCTYCCNDAIHAVYPDPRGYYRLKPVARLMDELLAHVKRNPKTRFISFYDDVLMGNRAWFEAFAERYKAEIDIGCFMTGRWELLTRHTIPLVKKLRCYFILIGVEVGDEELRCKVLRRQQKTVMMMERAALLRQNKVRYGLYTMVGLPTETLAKALETVKLSVRLKGNMIISHHSIFLPFPGTPLRDLAVAEGYLSDRKAGSYFDDSLLDMPAFPRAQVVWAHRRFTPFRLAYWLAFRLPARLSAPFEGWLDRLWMRQGLKAA
jgi:radical SAM superfamily enzyme YgiQ (UPF0313 family)